MHGGSKSMAASLFVPRAGAEVILENKFAYFSFRYVEISGLDAALPVGQVAGVVVHSDLPLTGTFISSSDMLNRVYAACANTMIYCSHGVYQDNNCVERGGYNVIRGQAITAFNYLYDAALFHGKYFADLRCQITDGKPPVQAPTKSRALGADLPGDQTFALVSPWRTYVAFGDRRELVDNLEMMDRFLAVYAEDFSTDIGKLHGWGEWGDSFIGTGKRPPTPFAANFQRIKGRVAAPGGGYGPLNTPTVLEVALKLYRAYALFGRVAEAAGKPELKDKYTAIAKQGRTQILARFYNAESKSFGSQAADALALEVGICDEQDRPGVAASLVSDFENVWNHRVSAGWTVNSIPAVMSANGYPDAALKVFTGTNAPGFAWFIENGLTTIPARWAMDPWPNLPSGRLCQGEKTGAIQWCFNGLGGIVPDESAPGFKRFFLAPSLPKDLESAEIGFESVHGRIASAWKREGDKIVWNVTVPWNTTATAHILAVSKDAITESGQPLDEAEGVKFVKMEDARAVCELASGSYTFEAEMGKK
jgi:alpha-L-rhamnosidase